MLKTNINKLRVLGLLEGISYLLLLGVCMPLKYLMDIPEPTSYVGMAHGILFIAYCLWVIIVAVEVKWGFGKIFWALLASLLPFGTFLADVWLFKPEKSQ
ncbi:DUF3817 domain-containing protein [Fulvivirga sp. 29W222]|uniref:DUF3817 domain-containing protein n=1 Tax=Fulvivirga marina TaxID=2494733 RepID=A0A937G1M4_9BACT|nr:DUF3817 domain-containing protein [Fulvivirga marina]MBL6449017.1 DUF3817 domain-containing protein [Fulvivirga marina]